MYPDEVQQLKSHITNIAAQHNGLALTILQYQYQYKAAELTMWKR